MLSRQRFVKPLVVVLLLTLLSPVPAALAADQDPPKQGGKLAGILIDKKDNWITVKADGEDEPVKYLIAVGSEKQVVTAMKSIFNASRVQLTYKQDGDSRQLVSIKKQVLRSSGIVTGVVVKVYNDFWVEVKPKNGLADAYAPGGELQRQSIHGKAQRIAAGRLGHNQVYDRLRAAPHPDATN